MRAIESIEDGQRPLGEHSRLVEIIVVFVATNATSKHGLSLLTSKHHVSFEQAIWCYFNWIQDDSVEEIDRTEVSRFQVLFFLELVQT